MLQYPSIESWRNTKHVDEQCIAFYKYDGSNLRWEYSPKRGWYKYGTRTQLFNAQTPLYNQAIQLYNDTIGPLVVEQVKQVYGPKTERITAFTEFYGPSSFAGSHDFDEAKILKLFDVSVYKRGFIPPKQFVQLFSTSEYSAAVIYEGSLSMQFIDNVRNGAYPVTEGVICKGDGWSTKVKTRAYLERLKQVNSTAWETEQNE